jgi:hypothetical protein
MPCTADSPSPRPGELAGEEGLEDPPLGLRVHPAACVLHLEEQVPALGEVPAQDRRAQPLPRGEEGAGGDADSTVPIPHRLGGVDDEIHHHLPKLARVAPQRRKPLRQRELEAELARYRRAEELDQVASQVGEVEQLRRDGRPARVGEHLLAQSGRRPGGLLDVGQAGGALGRGEPLGPEHRRVGQDGGE